MPGWLRRLPLLRRAPPAIPPAAWAATLARYPFLAERSGADLQRLRALAAEFLCDKQFTGARGFVITDEVALAIAAQAVLPVLHLPGALAWYDDFVGIVVHRSEVVAHRVHTDDAGVVHEYDQVLAGETMPCGPVMLSWQDVLAGGASTEAGYNVVIHEFAHKIDLRDGADDVDGCPPLRPGFLGARSAGQARVLWRAVLQPAYAQFRERSIVAERFGGPAPWLDAYGAQSIGEFFAVACEAYFVNRPRFADEFPELPPLFDAFFEPNRG